MQGCFTRGHFKIRGRRITGFSSSGQRSCRTRFFPSGCKLHLNSSYHCRAMATTMTVLGWSAEYAFDATLIRNRVPGSAGVYEICQSAEYPRYFGRTKTLKIGISKGNLQQELLNHFIRHAAANRLTRIRNRPGINVTFRYALLLPETVAATEKSLLREFEDVHWDLPALNSTRGYERGEDRRYCEAGEASQQI